MKPLILSFCLMVFIASMVLWLQRDTSGKLASGLTPENPTNTALALQDDEEAVEETVDLDLEFEPVERSMNQFMEFCFDPSYQRLKLAMANEEPTREQWLEMRGDIMVLAEGGNLLLMRLPEEDVELWQQYSIATREYGRDLYRAARSRRMERALEAYHNMIDNCNHCHVSHHEGEPILDY